MGLPGVKRRDAAAGLCRPSRLRGLPSFAVERHRWPMWLTATDWSRALRGCLERWLDTKLTFACGTDGQSQLPGLLRLPPSACSDLLPAAQETGRCRRWVQPLLSLDRQGTVRCRAGSGRSRQQLRGLRWIPCPAFRRESPQGFSGKGDHHELIFGRPAHPRRPRLGLRAPSLPEGFADTFTSRYVDTGDLRQHVSPGRGSAAAALVHGWPETCCGWTTPGSSRVMPSKELAPSIPPRAALA